MQRILEKIYLKCFVKDGKSYISNDEFFKATGEKKSIIMKGKNSSLPQTYTSMNIQLVIRMS